jgi:hypothetical protein
MWWFDKDRAVCNVKSFCGSYQYLGLRTFSTQAICNTELAKIKITPTIMLPDLIIGTSVTESLTTSGQYKIKMTFGNKGKGVTSGAGFRISLYIDPTGDPTNSSTTPYDSVVLSNVVLNPGTTEYYAIDTSLAVGNHKIYAIIDKDNAIKEENENNNLSYASYNVANSCGWCGNRCTRVTNACLIIPAPIGRSCIDSDGRCKIKITNGDGDANSDGEAGLADFAIWKRDYLIFSSIPTTSYEYTGPWIADWNNDKSIGLADFEIWKNAYISSQ